MAEEMVSPALARVAARFTSRFPKHRAMLEEVRRDLHGNLPDLPLKEVQSMLHDLAGTAAPLGYPELGNLASDAEGKVKTLRTSDAAMSSALLQQVDDSLQRVTKELEAS
ncbi:Hpt domain-containing protein [Altericroceibacterium endophyticum]|uniref:HPt domain-containing protein n=1 Tax=Altericroceibacterium endophyticum TaxID=1808508 RepID=A0A6I4T7G3_9SPHN|nr:Hpt domain-containing protein [Altericroceibacterium endophyticum]MXO66071.1 hypothetical protein [Altericroceibacterium endophyticum]